jgi:hypothetical protein
VARSFQSSAPAGRLASTAIVPSSGLSPVRYRNIAEQIASSLRHAIVTGAITPGGRLLEVPIAREMGTSRAPVREAIVIGHKRVADALRARDAARASRALATHLAEVLEMCVQRMRTPNRGKRAAAGRGGTAHSRMLKNPLLPRLLNKVQMQGGARRAE